jgi:hypothetical protein
MKKIEPVDLQKFREFEQEILQLEIPRVKYTPDLEIQAEVRRQVLAENFGEEKLAEVLATIGFEARDLGVDHLFLQVNKTLQNNLAL